MQMYFFNGKLGGFSKMSCHVSELRFFLSNASKGQRLHHRADSLCWCQLHPFGHGGHAPNRQPGSATTGARMWRMGARHGGGGKMCGWGLIGRGLAPKNRPGPIKERLSTIHFQVLLVCMLVFREAKQWGRFFSLTLGESTTNYIT